MTTTTTTTTTAETSIPPTSVAGVWQRLWEQDPIGDDANADKDTLVLWTQSPKSGIYVDIRLPKDAPGRTKELAEAAGFQPRPEALQGTGLTPLSKSAGNPADLLELFFQQKSFAGVMEFTHGDTTSGEALQKDAELAELASVAKDHPDNLPLCTCFWRRDMDYQPPTGFLDIGVCASGPPHADGSIDLRETGADGSYAELWHRLPGSDKGPFLALKLLSENGTERTGYWVRTGKHFAYAVGRPENAEKAASLRCHEQSAKLKTDCTGKSLKEAAEFLHSEPSVQMTLLGSYVGVTGELEKSGGSCCWKIQHSTDPGLVGCLLVGCFEDTQGLCCSTMSAIDINGNPKTDNELVEGDILYQALVGNGGPVRKWLVMEISGPSDIPGWRI
jgi:hypothetical protein